MDWLRGWMVWPEGRIYRGKGATSPLLAAKRYAASPTVETPRGVSPAAVPFISRDLCDAAGMSEGDAPRGVSTVGRISIGRGEGPGAAGPSGQQQLEILPAQLGDDALVGLDDGVGEGSLAGLELEDLFFDGVAGDEAVGEDGAGLADAVGAVDGLGFDGGVPPRVEEVDVVGGGEVEAEAAGFQADEEEAASGIGLELLHQLLAVAGLAVQVEVWETGGVEPAAEDAQEAGELGEDQRLVLLVEDLDELRKQEVELGAGIVLVSAVDQGGMAGGLAQSEESFEHQELRAA